MTSGRASLSIIVEWENARLAEAARPLAMLGELARQLDELARHGPRRVELLVLHDPEAIDGAEIEALVDRARPRAAWPATLRLLASANRTYYQQKNIGVGQATGEVVLFLDSDVVPEPGWLERLLGCLDDPRAAVVCGSTYIEPRDLYERAMALIWLFPLRPTADGVEEASSFYANNVALRRDVALANPFPDLPMFRGQCRILSQRLREQGFTILRHTGARVSHPPPNGLRHFVHRALCEGHDEALRDRASGRGLIGRGLKDFWRRLRVAARRIAADGRGVGLSAPGALGAFGVAFAYFGLKLGGRLLTGVDPAIVRRRFSI